MARKFLYLVAIGIVVVIGAMLGMRLLAPQLTRLAYVPRTHFVAQLPLVDNAYASRTMWFARPDMGDDSAADWLPPGWSDSGETPARAAVFFVHPTSYTGREQWNASLDDRTVDIQTRLLVRAMASAFNGAQAVWAPRYRQATFGAFLSDSPDATAAIDLAYGDVARAFDAFLKATPPDIPIALAGHSQGALHVIRLLKERVAGTPLTHRIVAVYALGWPISIAHDLPALGLPACERPDQTGCIVSWSSYAEPADPSLLLDAFARSTGFDGQPRGDRGFVCTNPLTGQAGGSAPATANLGTLLPTANFTGGAIVPAAIPARCDERGLLLIGPPPTMGPFVLPGNNYHVYDIPLFWANLRADFARRSAAWSPQH